MDSADAPHWSEALGSAASTWAFQFLFGLFNVAVLWSTILRYGFRLSSLSFDSSHYTLVLAFSVFSVFCQVIYLLNKLAAQYFLGHEDSDSRVFSGLYRRFSYSYFCVVYLMSPGYITSLVDLLIISSTLVLNSCFSVSHELAESRKNEVLASGAFNIRKSLTKVRAYLILSVILNTLSLSLIVWIFFPLEVLLLFLLWYKGMQSLLYGVVHWNEICVALKQIELSNDLEGGFFIEPTTKYFLRLLEIVLDSVYIGVIAKTKGISTQNYSLLFYLSVCGLLLSSKAWELYAEHEQFRTYVRKIYSSMNEYMVEEVDEEACGICMGTMRLAVLLPCGHPFHRFCLIQLVISGKVLCPICKQNIDGKGLKARRQSRHSVQQTSEELEGILRRSQTNTTERTEDFL